MTPMEQRLAKRISEQRKRLRYFEALETQRREYHGWTRTRWLTMACKLLRENEQLRARLKMDDRFNQPAALAEHIP